MNRIVVVGNGYDLSRGLKSKYEHFVIEYLKRCIKIAKNNESLNYIDRLIKVEYGNKAPELFEEFDYIESIEQLKEVSFIIVKDMSIDFDFIPDNPIIKVPEEAVIVNITSKFFLRIFKDIKWADIEKIYFEELMETYQRSLLNNLTLGPNNPIGLNKDFECIKMYLIKYLNNLDTKHQSNSLTPLSLDFLYKRLTEEVDDLTFQKYFNQSDKNIKTLKFINFNYTDQLDIDLKRLSSTEPNITNIHGSLHELDSVIFGYGDNRNENYKKLRKSDIYDYLKHLKPFKYRANNNLNEFFSLLENDCFDVIILGHSLGISDRYLLSKIFQHKNCKLIRIFNRPESSKYKFDEKVSALSFHFENEEWEDKIATYNKNDSIG